VAAGGPTAACPHPGPHREARFAGRVGSPLFSEREHVGRHVPRILLAQGRPRGGVPVMPSRMAKNTRRADVDSRQSDW
jgi:hypothetical protein